MFCKSSLVLVVFTVIGIGAQRSSRATVPNLDAELYVGRWYQMYTNFWSDTAASLTNATCITADYGAISPVNVTVYNAYYNLYTKENGSISGYAYIPDLQDPGKLIVKLDGVPADGNYWIFKLGPIYEGLYDYSLITDDFDLTLYVLARDTERFKKLYKNEVLEYLELVGFTDGLRAPQEVPHTTDCLYPKSDNRK